MSNQRVKPEPASNNNNNNSNQETQPAPPSPSTGGDGQPVEFTIKDSDQGEIKFRVKSHTPLQKVFTAWAKKKSVNETNYRFIAADSGQRLNGHQTAAEVGLENGDVIDAMAEQVGGIQNTEHV